MPLLWRIPDDFPERAIGEYERSKSPDRFLFREGRVLEIDGMPTLKFDVPSVAIPPFDCLPNNSLVPLVNSRVKRVLEQLCPSDVQLFEASVIAADRAVTGYWLVNATHSVRGLDRSRSVYTHVPGTDQIMAFQKVHYHEDCLGRHHVARDAEYRSHLLVSGELHKRFQEQVITGVVFLFPEEVYQ